MWDNFTVPPQEIKVTRFCFGSFAGKSIFLCAVMSAGLFLAAPNMVQGQTQLDPLIKENLEAAPVAPSLIKEQPEAAAMPEQRQGMPQGQDQQPYPISAFQEPVYRRYGFQPPYPPANYTSPGYYPSGSPDYEPQGGYRPYQQSPLYRTGINYLPQGLTIPISLRTSISTQVAKEGDFIEATVSSNVPLQGSSYIPAGTVVSGQITEAKAGRRLSRSGSLSIQFNDLRLPDGASMPISAHLVGSIGRYKDVNGVERGEGWKAKLGQFAIRGVAGAGLGAALGTGLGAIAGGGRGVGTGAWAGAAFGGGLGAMDMLLRKGRDVIIPSGTEMQLQMDEPASLPIAS